jgi:hypothetical protein
MERVLVGAPINKAKHYCLDDYLRQCLSLTYLNADFYFVDNSADSNYHLDEIVSKGWDCDYVAPNNRRNCEYICESQSAIRHRVLTGGYDYLMFIEEDIEVPVNIIEQLISYRSPVVACNYFINHGNRAHLLKTEIEHPAFGKFTNRNIDQMGGFVEHGRQPKYQKSSFYGFGCTMIHRDILEQYPFMVMSDDEAHSDTVFYFKLYENGVIPVLHPLILKHNNSDWRDIKDHVKSKKSV